MWHFIPREIRVQCYCLCLLAKFFISATFLHFWNWCFLSADIYDEGLHKTLFFQTVSYFDAVKEIFKISKTFPSYSNFSNNKDLAEILRHFTSNSHYLFFCGKLSLNSTYVHSLIGWLLCEWVGKFLASHSQKAKKKVHDLRVTKILLFFSFQKL